MASARRELLRRIGDRDKLVPAAVAALLCGRTEAAIRKAAERGNLRAEHVGRRLLFRVRDLVEDAV
jgi:hypothetical protein